MKHKVFINTVIIFSMKYNITFVSIYFSFISFTHLWPMLSEVYSMSSNIYIQYFPLFNMF